LSWPNSFRLVSWGPCAWAIVERIEMRPQPSAIFPLEGTERIGMTGPRGAGNGRAHRGTLHETTSGRRVQHRPPRKCSRPLDFRPHSDDNKVIVPGPPDLLQPCPWRGSLDENRHRVDG